ncbi:DUF305 domain-containing protein [Rhizobium sp. AC27/96]|uniref:DUF4142 domain-containing protein n=1 Tax=Rhizobium TaxID=379 RepID=UPI0008280544|nr:MULTISPECIES: DUF4142 domain-containing protein [Rhizobium]NTF46574.1 DUF4142 domain-containing protein [Rhizobium rhizogenes]OCI99633.1 DUF305 domain-containing protein [Rhizobium sp. AC27/96]
MKPLTLFAFAALITAPAFAQSAAEKTGVNSMMGAAPKTTDFVQEAATSDMFEIASSKLALERGNAATKTFAQQMVTDHQKTTSELKGLVSSGKVKARLPTAMTSSQQGMLKTLRGQHGAAFDKRYQADQEKAHKDAVDLFKRYGDGGDNTDLKAWAASTGPALQHHLQMAEDLNKQN